MDKQTILDIIDKASNKYGLDKKYLRALAQIESNFNPNAKNSIGASGLFQFMPGTAKQYGLSNPFDPAANSDAAGRMFKENLTKFGDPFLAAAAHNMGPGNVAKFKTDVSRYPRETQNYVQKFKALTGLGQGNDVGNISNSDTSLQSEATPQNSSLAPDNANLDPLQLLLKQPSEQPSKLSNILGIISTLGGNIANIIGGIKGTGATGNAAIASGLSLINENERRKSADNKVSQVNALLSNPSLPQELRVAIGLGAQGVPNNLIDKFLQKPDQAEIAKKAIELQQAKQNLITSSPDYKEKLSSSDEERQKRLLDYKNSAEASINTNKRERLPATQVTQLGEARSALNQLQNLDSDLKKDTYKGGPITGFIGSLNPYDTKAQATQASINTVKQTIGKFLEGGVLRKEDEEKYSKILPTLRDTPEVRRVKILYVNRLLTDRYNQYIQSFDDAGYNVDKFKTKVDPNSDLAIGSYAGSQGSGENSGTNQLVPDNRSKEDRLKRYNELLKKSRE